MGYTTDLYGKLSLSRPLTDKEYEYINKFSGTRRMKRDVNKLMELHQGKHGFPFDSLEGKTAEEIYGKEGAYFIGGTGMCGQDFDETVIDGNTPPGQLSYSGWEKSYAEFFQEEQKMINSGECQPGLWCQWIINEDNELEWDGGEKFYEYTNWLKYLIKNFFEPWGVFLNGEIEWQGEDRDDFGKIIVVDNEVEERQGRKIY